MVQIPMRRLLKLLFAFGLLAAFNVHGAETNFTPLALEGQTFIHDPSTIIKDGTNYYIFGTGPGIRTKSSPDLIHWDSGEPVYRTPPAWTTKAVPEFHGGLIDHFYREKGTRLYKISFAIDIKKLFAIAAKTNDSIIGLGSCARSDRHG